jgi:hypothetical protein
MILVEDTKAAVLNHQVVMEKRNHTEKRNLMVEVALLLAEEAAVVNAEHEVKEVHPEAEDNHS